MEWFAKLMDLHKLPTRHVGLISIVSGMLLFSPVWLLDRLHLSKIPSPYGTLVGIAFLVSISLLTVNSTNFAYASFKRRGWSEKRRATIKEYLSSLDPHEQAVLREFFVTGLSTLKIPMDNPSVVGLEVNGIIERTGPYGNFSIHGMMFPYRISKTAVTLISDDHLGISSCVTKRADGEIDITPEGFDWMRSNRPSFVQDRLSHW